GFGNGHACVERVTSVLAPSYDEVDAFTFSEAMSNPDRVRKAVRNVQAVTHSAGMLALVGTSPERIDAFDPPLPTSKLRLIGRAGIKTVRMYTPGIGIESPYDIPAVGIYGCSTIAELRVKLNKQA